MKNDMSFKKIKSTLTQNRANKTTVEHASALLELKMKEVYEKGFKDGQGSSDVNPYKIKIEEQFADPDDPNRPIEEQKRLRRNWYQRRSYHRRKEKQKQDDQTKKVIQQLLNALTKKQKKKTATNQSQPQAEPKSQVER